MKIWLVEWNSESSDRGVVGFWLNEPSKSKIIRYLKRKYPREVIRGDKGGDEYDATLYWELVSLEDIT